MPRIDPITGCEVMTFPEFICEEAKNKGQDPSEFMEDIYSVMSSEQKSEEDRLRDPKECLCFLNDIISSGGEENIHIKKVIQVLAANYSGTFGGTSCYVKALVLCENNKKQIAYGYCSYDYGDRMNPPEEDYGIEFENVGIHGWFDRTIKQLKSFIPVIRRAACRGKLWFYNKTVNKSRDYFGNYEIKSTYIDIGYWRLSWRIKKEKLNTTQKKSIRNLKYNNERNENAT